MAKHSPRLLELAKRGAEAQLSDLLHEAKMLIELFPHLRDSFDREELPLNFIMAKGSGEAAAQRPRRKMSAAARKKISEAQKKRWAAQKKAKAAR
jgi:hypothetical protein